MKVIFGVNLPKKNYGLFITLLGKVLYKSYLTVSVLLFRLSLAVSTLIFILKLSFEITSQCPLLLHFSMFGIFPETIFFHLLPVPLLKCFTCLFFLSSSVSPPDLDLLFHTELFDFVSAKICFIPVGL